MGRALPTVLSSQASGCNHLVHVETQMPYAVLVGALSLVGLVLVGFGVSQWIVLPAGVVALMVWLQLAGRRADA